MSLSLVIAVAAALVALLRIVTYRRDTSRFRRGVSLCAWCIACGLVLLLYYLPQAAAALPMPAMALLAGALCALGGLLLLSGGNLAEAARLLADRLSGRCSGRRP